MWQFPNSQKTAQGLSRGQGKLLPDNPASQWSSCFFWLRRLNLHLFSFSLERIPPFFNWYFGKFTEFGHYHYDPVLERFHHSKKICCAYQQWIPSYSHPRAAIHLPSAPTDLSFLDVSCKWKPTVHTLHIWLLSCNSSSMSSVCQCAIPIYGWGIFPCMDVPQCIYPFTSWQAFALSARFALNKAAKNICVVFV